MVKLGVQQRGKATRACGHLVVSYFLLWKARAAWGLSTIIRAISTTCLRSLGLSVFCRVVPR
jgi:hypothetical protein